MRVPRTINPMAIPTETETWYAVNITDRNYIMKNSHSVIQYKSTVVLDKTLIEH